MKNHQINSIFSKRGVLRLRIFLKLVILIVIVTGLNGCKKLVLISPPKDSITTPQVFADSADATAAIAGIYSSLFNQNKSAGNSFAGGAIGVLGGSSADELLPFDVSGDQITLNAITSDNGIVGNVFWTQPYSVIYEANAAIEGLNNAHFNPETKSQLIGEAKFLRAFCYFYLVNFFGDVPLITTTDYKTNSLASRSSKEIIYNAIISDLKDSQSLLSGDFSAGGGERVRANKWAATALLARTYLFHGDWSDAEKQATSIISNVGAFQLNTNLNEVFLKNNSEAILQWQPNTAYFPYNVTPEGVYYIPYDATRNPNSYLNNLFLKSFEPGDQRRVAWVDSTVYLNHMYYFPFKYKQGVLQRTPNSSANEYCTVLRLAEQYLIRSEAKVHLSEANAIEDLNVIRSRAGLKNYGGATDLTSLLNAIYHERQIELFSEWGNRWLDLKRTGNIDQVMTVATPLKNGGTIWKNYQQYYPIPLSELKTDPNLSQNPGY